MMSGKAIEQLSAKAARKAARLKRIPMMAFVDRDKEVMGCPNLGDYRPKGWELIDSLFVDKIGCGGVGEPALTVQQFIDSVKEGLGYAIIKEGQFQLYIGVFKRN